MVEDSNEKEDRKLCLAKGNDSLTNQEPKKNHSGNAILGD